MAWIEQTKKGSRISGGPQYYLQDLSPNSSQLLTHRKTCPIRLWTIYGIVETGLIAVSTQIGKVGHNRVQRADKKLRTLSIADQVAYWYKLKSSDIERIEFQDSLDKEAFVISPTQITFFKARRPQKIDKDSHPLTLTANHRSALLCEQIENGYDLCNTCQPWVSNQVATIVEQHKTAGGNVDERDLLRASGALSRIGINLGLYRTHGIDCQNSFFEMCGYPAYSCPVEIEEKSSGFLATHHRVHRKQRLVVLCLKHDASEVLQDYVDVIELAELSKWLTQ